MESTSLRPKQPCSMSWVRAIWCRVRDTAFNFAIYHIVTPDVLVRDPEDFNFFILCRRAGRQRAPELTVSGHLAPGVTAMASYGYNPTEVTKSPIPAQERSGVSERARSKPRRW